MECRQSTQKRWRELCKDAAKLLSSEAYVDENASVPIEIRVLHLFTLHPHTQVAPAQPKLNEWLTETKYTRKH